MNPSITFYNWLLEIGRALGLSNEPSYSHASTLSLMDHAIPMFRVDKGDLKP